jgi:proteasome accessory factor B
MRRLHRILKIVRLLELGQPYGANKLARECHVCRRTVFRDLEAIEEAGFIIWHDYQTRAYRIHQPNSLAPINLDVSEAGELLLVASLLDETQGIPLLHAGRAVVSKLEAHLPLDIKLDALRRARATAIRPGPTVRSDALQATYDLVLEAISRRLRLRCRYLFQGDSMPLSLYLEPYWLLFYRHEWYVVGRNDRHNRVCTFRLSRLEDMTLTKQKFARPAVCSLADCLGNAWGVMPGGKTYEVRLRFSHVVGADVAEVQWHKTQRTTRESNGSVLFSATVDGLDEIAWWVHSFGAHVEILEPDALRTRVAEIASPYEESALLHPLAVWD